jgi:hypothetical protein
MVITLPRSYGAEDGMLSGILYVTKILNSTTDWWP